MGDPPRRQTTNPSIKVREENAAPQLNAARAGAVPRPKPIGHDDAEHVREMERLERERATLLAKLKDAEQENKLLREIAPTVVFPPPSIPPPAAVPATISSTPADIKAIEKAIIGSKLGRRLVAIGIALGLIWNAFNTVRQEVPIQKAEKAGVIAQQNAQLTAQESEKLTLERQRTLQALRAIKCWAKQTRGGFQRQGLDLTSLPAGGIRVMRVEDDDPNRRPVFIVEEKCPDFPELPPEGSAR